MSELLPAASVAPTAAPTPSPAGRALDAGQPPLRVMSFNVRFGTADDGPDRWEYRRDLLARTILAFGPDLLGVQEALDFQCDEIAERLGKAYAFHGAGREDGRRRGEFTGIYYLARRFERLAAGNFWLSQTPEKVGSVGWDAELPRLASWVKLRDLAARHDVAANSVLFLNTHWDHLGNRARRESARLIRHKVHQLQPEGSVVIVGDFNAREDDEEYAELLRAADEDGHKYVDAYRELHPDRHAAEASFHAFKGGREGTRIDWILHSTDLKAVEALIDHSHEDGRYPSDHYPITAVLTKHDES